MKTDNHKNCTTYIYTMEYDKNITAGKDCHYRKLELKNSFPLVDQNQWAGFVFT